MDKSVKSPAQIVVMAMFALSCFGLLLFLWLSFGGATPLKPEGYRVNVPMKEVLGLGQSSDVRISGVPVGKVAKVERVGDHTQVQIELDDRYAPLAGDARATLRRKTLLGEAYVELTAGSRAVAPLTEGATLPEAQVRPSVDVDEILSGLDARSRRDVQAWFQGWSAGMRGRARDISDTIGHLPGALESGESVLSVLRGQSAATRTLVRDTGRTFRVFGRRDARVRELIEAGERTFAATAARDDELAATVGELPGFLRSLDGALDSAQRLAGPLTPVLADLRPGARILRPTLTRTAAVTPDLEGLASDLDDLVDVAPAGLSDVRATLAAARPLLDQLYPLGRQIVPVIDYARLYRQELSNSWPKVSGVLQARSVDPDTGKFIHYLRAPAVVTNETLVVAGKRQPYSRPSTYSTPGGVRDLEKGGLKAFDCSHTSNPVTVLPLGPFPPCVQQDKVTFRGETSSFPQLKPAP